MEMKAKFTAKGMKTSTKTEKDGEIVRLVTTVTFECRSSAGLSARLAALHAMLLEDLPIEVSVGCNQAVFDLMVNSIDKEGNVTPEKQAVFAI